MSSNASSKIKSNAMSKTFIHTTYIHSLVNIRVTVTRHQECVWIVCVLGGGGEGVEVTFLLVSSSTAIFQPSSLSK